jgi:hypothetical protein
VSGLSTDVCKPGSSRVRRTAFVMQSEAAAGAMVPMHIMRERPFLHCALGGRYSCTGGYVSSIDELPSYMVCAPHSPSDARNARSCTIPRTYARTHEHTRSARSARTEHASG